MTPQESLALITEVIQEAKARHEENGITYIFWGSLVAVVSLAHFALLQMDRPEIIFVPYLLLPLASLLFYVFLSRRRRTGSQNIIGTVIRYLWIISSINMALAGFLLWNELGTHLIPFILVLLGISLSLSGAALQSQALLWGGVLANVAGICGFWVPMTYQPLLMAGANLVGVTLPGMFLYWAYRRRRHV